MRYALMLSLYASLLGAATYTIKPEPGARFALEVHKTGLMSGKVHVFEYERYSGHLDFDPATPEAARIDITINAASIACRDTWVDDKDKKKVTQTALDMMQATNHPEMRFVSDSARKRADGGFDVSGNLTLKGITKPITVVVTAKPNDGGWTFIGKGTVLRKSYKVDPPSPVPFGIIGNKEEMPVTFTLIARP